MSNNINFNLILQPNFQDLFHAKITDSQCANNHNNDYIFSIYKIWVLTAGFLWEINVKTFDPVLFGPLHHDPSLSLFPHSVNPIRIIFLFHDAQHSVLY